MKIKVLMVCLGLTLAGCATYQGGTGDDYRQTDYGRGGPEVDAATGRRGTTDFGRGSNRFNQDSSEMIWRFEPGPDAEPDSEIFRQH